MFSQVVWTAGRGACGAAAAWRHHAASWLLRRASNGVAHMLVSPLEADYAKVLCAAGRRRCWRCRAWCGTMAPAWTPSARRAACGCWPRRWATAARAPGARRSSCCVRCNPWLLPGTAPPRCLLWMPPCQCMSSACQAGMRGACPDVARPPRTAHLRTPHGVAYKHATPQHPNIRASCCVRCRVLDASPSAQGWRRPRGLSLTQAMLLAALHPMHTVPRGSTAMART